jgi:hypothetical protein
MKSNNRHTRVLTIFTIMAIIFSISGTARAVDDGARAYWKGRDGTNVFSLQYLNLNMQASDTQQFDPAHFIYPNADTEADVLIASYARHMTLFNRASTFSANIVGGSVDVDVNSGAVPPQFLPASTASTSAFKQSASGYGDPSIQLDVNLFGTSPLKSTVDLLNYEPTSTFDIAMMLAMPLGEYDSDKLVNMGLNRWYGRIAFPYTYHFGTFSRGYMSSLELTPSVWLFADNDDFLGQNLKNDPLMQFEAHLTHDFTRNFFGSLDLLYRNGFESEINGVGVGEELDIGDLGFTLNAQVTDNVAIRGSFSSNVFGDDDLDTSMIRLQLVYGWNPTSENQKKLTHGEN